jgi:hypothetical protein
MNLLPKLKAKCKHLYIEIKKKKKEEKVPREPPCRKTRAFVGKTKRNHLAIKPLYTSHLPILHRV